jgi:hypothetical protein
LAQELTRKQYFLKFPFGAWRISPQNPIGVYYHYTTSRQPVSRQYTLLR